MVLVATNSLVKINSAVLATMELMPVVMWIQKSVVMESANQLTTSHVKAPVHIAVEVTSPKTQIVATQANSVVALPMTMGTATIVGPMQVVVMVFVIRTMMGIKVVVVMAGHLDGTVKVILSVTPAKRVAIHRQRELIRWAV